MDQIYNVAFARGSFLEIEDAWPCFLSIGSVCKEFDDDVTSYRSQPQRSCYPNW